MVDTKKNILITGFPGVGKTTLLIRLAKALNQYKPVGFYTSEIKEKGIRKGFELATLDGRKGLLSHVNIASPFRVGKYGVDISGFEGFLDSIDFRNVSNRLIVIDEIGRMECLSAKFRRLIEQILDSEKIVIATIALKGEGFIEAVKRRQDVALFEITLGSRDPLAAEILDMVKRQIAGSA